MRLILRNKGTMTLRRVTGLAAIDQAHFVREWERECSRKRKKGKQTRPLEALIEEKTKGDPTMLSMFTTQWQNKALAVEAEETGARIADADHELSRLLSRG